MPRVCAEVGEMPAGRVVPVHSMPEDCAEVGEVPAGRAVPAHGMPRDCAEVGEVPAGRAVPAHGMPPRFGPWADAFSERFFAVGPSGFFGPFHRTFAVSTYENKFLIELR